MFNKLHKPNGRLRDRLDFKFSNFQALQVPKGWDRLVISIISVETGKTIAKLGKSYVKGGSCQWTEILSEFIWMYRDVSSKEYEESLIKIVVSMGSVKSSILGEATINLANFTSSRVATALLQPLEKCGHGTILQVKIQCVAPRTKLRDEEPKNSVSQETDLNHESGSQSNGSDYQDQATKSSSLSEEFDSNERNDGVFGDSTIPENVSVVSPSNDSLTSDIDKDEETVYNEPSLKNLGSSKNLLDVAEHTIDELRAEAKMWERNARKLMIDLEISKKEFSDISKKEKDVVMELAASNAEYNHLKSKNEQLKLEVQKLAINKANKDDSFGNKSAQLLQIQKVLETEAKHQEDMNASLEQQLKQTQESNIELVTVLQELEETIEQQKTEIKNLSSLQFDSIKFEESVAKLSEANKILQESEKALQAEVLSLEEALREKSSKLENEKKLKLSSHEKDIDLTGEIESLKEKLQELEDECAELTEENLELLIKLKDSNKSKSFDSSHGDESEVSNPTFHICHHETDMQEKNAIIKELEKKIEEHEKSKAKFELDYAGVVKNMEKKTLEVDCIKADFLSKEQESEFILQHQRELETEISKLQQQNINLKEKYELVLTERDCISETVGNLQNDIIILQNNVDSHISASTILEKKLEDVEIERNELDVNLSGLQDGNMQLHESVSSLESQIKQLKDEMKLLQKERDHSKKIATGLQDEIQSLEVQIWDLKQKSVDDEKQWHEVEIESEHLKSENQKLQASAKSLDISNLGLKNENQEFREECLNLAAQLNKLTMSLSDSEKKVEILENHLKDFSIREATLKSELDALVQENDIHKEKLHLDESLRQTISKKTTEFESLQKEVDQLNGWKQSHEMLKAENERTLKILGNYKVSEEKLKTDMNDIELKLTISDYERQELIKEMDALKVQLQTVSNLEEEIVSLKNDLKECRVDKCKLEVALKTVSRDYEEMNALNTSLSENISKLEDTMSDFEECKIRKSALEEKIKQMENDVGLKDVPRSPNADQRNDLMEIKRANVQFKQKIHRLEKEKEALLKKAQSLEEDLKLMEEKLHLQQEAAKNHNCDHGSSVSAEQEAKEDSHETKASESSPDGQKSYERSKSSIETELKDLSERYLEMSLKYAEVEAQREDLVMKLKASGGGKRWFS